MPIIVKKSDAEVKLSNKMQPELELYTVCGWGKCPKRLDRVLKKRPDVNWKNEDGMTALHQAVQAGSAEFCRKLLEAKADPNIPAGEWLLSPLEWCTSKIMYEEERDARLNGFDTVNRLDDSCTAIRPDIKPHYEVRKVLEEAGAVEAKARSSKPNILPDGSVKGGPASPLRSYTLSADGSFTTAYHLRSGKYDMLNYEDGKLIEAEYDVSTGKWHGFDEAAAKLPQRPAEYSRVPLKA